MTGIGKSNAVQKDWRIFCILDTSSNMSKGGKIDILNRSMQEMVEALQQAARHNSEITPKIAVLAYNTNCHWLTENGPKNVTDFAWKKLKAGGLANLGTALRELNDKLHFWMKPRMWFTPLILFVSGGSADDSWKAELEQLRQNRWFDCATKIGFSTDQDMEILTSIVGHRESVLHADNLEVFKKLIQVSPLIMNSHVESFCDWGQYPTTSIPVASEDALKYPDMLDMDDTW